MLSFGWLLYELKKGQPLKAKVLPLSLYFLIGHLLNDPGNPKVQNRPNQDFLSRRWAAAEAMADVTIDCKNSFKNELKKRTPLTPPLAKKNKPSLSSVAHIVASKHITPEWTPEGHGR
jgi:hypothetical protein